MPEGTPTPSIDRTKNIYENAFYHEYLAPGMPGESKVSKSLFGGKKSRRRSSKKFHRKSSKKSHRKSRRGRR